MKFINKNLIVLFLIVFCTSWIDAQLYFNPDRHSTNSFDGWISCTTSANPNPARGTGHWIKYDLGQSYNLGSSHIWNVNDPDNLDAGIQTMAIDYSVEGELWEELGVFTVEKSAGSLYYSGVVGPNFNSKKVRYIIFTALDNYGASCSGFSEWRVNVIDSSLPLELLSFDVDCESGQVNKITWTTEKELNIDHYLIERSIDALDWATVETIGSKGEGEKRKTYEAINAVGNESYYYRLKIVELSGEFRYSDIVISDCKNEFNTLSMFPNPTTDISNISFHSQVEGLYSYKLYDILGKKIKEGQNDLVKGQNQFILQTKELSPGDYFMHISINKNLMVKKLVVF